MRPALLDFLRQDHSADCPLEETLARLGELAERLEAGQPAAKA
jgi:hypothetical protein